jgi:hypothetical protein
MVESLPSISAFTRVFDALWRGAPFGAPKQSRAAVVALDFFAPLAMTVQPYRKLL